MIISLKEARNIPCKMAKEMTDEEIMELVDNPDEVAVDALRRAREGRMEEDAKTFAELLYDIYQDKKRTSPDNRDKKE